MSVMQLINKNKYKTLSKKDYDNAEKLFQQGKNEKEILKCLETWEKSNLFLKFLESCVSKG
jgi:hypothetical protein